MKPEAVHPSIRFESTDVNAKAVVMTGVAIIVTVIVFSAIIFGYFSFLLGRRERLSPPVLPMNARGVVLPPEPRLQPSPRNDLRELRIAENDALQKYGWIDKSHGRLAIPIDRAMQLIAQRGIPPQTAPDSLKLYEPHAGTRQTGFEGKVEPEPR